MAQTYRDVAINQMIATTEEAMSHAIDWWGDLPTSMKEAIDKFRVQLGAAIDSVEFVKRALDRQVPETSWKATDQRLELLSDAPKRRAASCSSNPASICWVIKAMSAFGTKQTFGQARYDVRFWEQSGHGTPDGPDHLSWINFHAIACGHL